MTIELVIIGFLIAIIVLQQGFHMWKESKLINKLMSRDFHSYAQTIKPPQPMTGFRVELPPEGPDPLKQLNQTFGL